VWADVNYCRSGLARLFGIIAAGGYLGTDDLGMREIGQYAEIKYET
jgi:hypothetical protein